MRIPLIGLALSLAACVPAGPPSLGQDATERGQSPLLQIADAPNDAALRTAPRLALVIGNNSYKRESWEPLRLADNDASAVARKLSQRGFKLIGGSAQLNVTAQKFNKLASDLQNAISENKNAIVVFYFSGHGFSDNGHNYLAPIDDQNNSQSTAISINATNLASKLKDAGAGLVAMFLEACRNNPTGHPGALSAETVPDNVFIGFSSLFGTTSKEPLNGEHGPYTAAFLKALDLGFSRFDDMHFAISAQVIRDTDGHQAPVFRQGARMPDTPVRLAANDPQTIYALDRRSPASKVASDAALCAAQSDFKFALNMTYVMSPDSNNSIFANVINPVDVHSIKTSCQYAFDNGKRTPAVLRGLGVIKMASHNPQDFSHGIALLTEAAELGDGLANYLIAFNGIRAGRPLNLGITTDQITTRLIAAADKDPELAGLVGITLFNSRSDTLRTEGMIARQKDVGYRLFRKAVLSGDSGALLIAFVMKVINPEVFHGLDLYRILDNGVRPNGYISLISNGINGNQLLYYVATQSAFVSKDWPVFIRLMLQTASFYDDIEHALDVASGRSPRPGLTALMAGCMLGSGKDVFDKKPIPGITPDIPLASRFIKHAEELGGLDDLSRKIGRPAGDFLISLFEQGQACP
jgi:hypothetical protein